MAEDEVRRQEAERRVEAARKQEQLREEERARQQRLRAGPDRDTRRPDRDRD